MEVIVAKTAGFCFGVKRAVEQVYEQIAKAEKPVYTYGPIIHNEFVVKDLEKKGVCVLNTEEELSALTDGIVVIRSHGVGKHIYDLLEAHHITVVDATCPFVKKIHRIVSSSSEVRNTRRCRASADGEMIPLWWWKNRSRSTIFCSPKRKNFVLCPKRHLITRNFKI